MDRLRADGASQACFWCSLQKLCWGAHDNLQVVCAYSSETDGSVGGVQWLELTVCLKARGSQQIWTQSNCDLDLHFSLCACFCFEGLAVLVTLSFICLQLQTQHMCLFFSLAAYTALWLLAKSIKRHWGDVAQRGAYPAAVAVDYVLEYQNYVKIVFILSCATQLWEWKGSGKHLF